MKLNMDMRSFFKLIGRKSKHFFSLLFVWAFFQSNIQAQTTEVLVDIDFLSDEWSSGDLPTQGSVNDVYFGNDFAIVAEGLDNTGGNMTKERFAAVQFTIPEGRTVEYVTLEVKMSKEKGKMRARLLKADTIVFPADFLVDKDNYIALQAADGDYVISKQLQRYAADDQVNNGGEPIVPGNYVFYFGRGSSYQYIQSLKISYTYSNVSCTPLTISDGTSDLTSLNLEKGNSATLSATTSDGTSVDGTWSVENANQMGVVTMDGNTVRASSDIGSAELVFTPADNTYCEAVIPVYVAEGDAPAPTVVGENFDNSTTSWCFGEPLTVTATSTPTTGTGTFAYQWYKDDVALAGQTQSNYSPEAKGKYYCKVTYTESGYFPVTVESPHATITILTPQIGFDITGAGMYNIGETAKLQVTASGGDGSYSYQWYSADNENGDGAVAISGATSAAYLASSASAQTFYYFCEISSGACTETTDVQTVTFTDGPCYELIFTATSGTVWESSYDVSGGAIDIVGETSPEYDEKGFLFNNGADILKVTLDKAIEVGTEIEVIFTTNNIDRGIVFYADAEKKTQIAEFIGPTADTYRETYIVDENSGMKGVTSFYVTRKEGNTYLKSIRIYCGKPCQSSGLAWEPSECTVEYGDQNPSYPTLYNPNTLKSIQYSSSVPEVATIDATLGVLDITGTGTTTITATFEGDETYCSESVSYTLTVTCSDPVPFISPERGAIECTGGVELSLSYQNPGGTTGVDNVSYAWYQQDADGTWEKIDDATSDTYTATAAGIYKALVTANCPQWTGNKAVVTLSQDDPPVVEKLTPFQYYQLDSLYAVEGREMRHLFKVTPPKGTEGNPYEVSATIHRGTTINSLLSVNWITSKNNTDTIIADYNVLTAWSKNNANAIQTGDTIVVKVAPRNMCNKIDETYADSISIIVLGRNTHTIAYVVSGTDVNNLFDVTSDDIGDSLYTDKLVEMGYLPIAVNGYANYKFLNYEPFDLVLLTDYPKTDGKIGSGSGDTVRAGNLDNLADLVDRKPIFSLKAHMAALEKWKAKGFTGNPLTPSDNPQTEMTVLCYAHEMFKNIDMGTDENNNKIITVTEGGGSDGNKALQGFATFDVVEFVNIATINGGTQGTLVACCERQKVVESRMMVLSINNTATQLITDDGYTAIGNILEYLLITDPVFVSDCSLVFTNGLDLNGNDRNVDGDGDGMWNNPLNWAPGFNMVPTLSHRVRIDKPCTVNVKAGVSAVSIRKDKDNNWEGSLTVEPGAKLAVAGRFREVRGRDFVNSYKIESEGSLTIETNETAAGAFMVYDSVAPYAQVEFYSKASGAKAQTGTDVPTEAVWQYMAIPTSGYPQAVKPFEGAWMCRWDEANPNMSYPQAHWHVVKDNDQLYPFEGYALTQKNVTTYQLAGFLNVNDHTYKGLTYTSQTSGDNYTDGEKTYPKTYPGFHLLGNSFTAPIYLDSLKDEDFVYVEPTIYIYNAGTWEQWYDNNVGDGNSTTAGQYMALPIHAGSYAGLNVIPAMQGFFVKATSAAGTGNGSVSIDYRNAVVRPNYYEASMPPPVVRAPQKEKTEIPILKMRVEGKRFADELYLLCREDWTHAYEPGFDGKKIYGDSRTPQLFAIEADDNMSVNAVDDIDGQYLGFIAGEETEYTLTFDPSTLNGQYSRLYLHDLTAGTSIDLLASDSYSFSVGKKGETRRFLISSSSTVNEEVDSGLLKGYAYDGVLYVENFTDSEGDWTVYDAMGRKIDYGTIPGLGRYSFKLNLPYGTYVVYLRTNSIVKPVKVIF